MFRAEHTIIDTNGTIRDINTFIIDEDNLKNKIKTDKETVKNYEKYIRISYGYINKKLVEYCMSYQDDNNFTNLFTYTRI